MPTFPCRYLKPLEAQFLWELSEEYFLEARHQKDHKHSAIPSSTSGRRNEARRRLERVLEELDIPSYRDVAAMVWVGRGADDDYEALRQIAETSLHPIYIGSKGKAPHRHLRKALELYGVSPLRAIDESAYEKGGDFEEEEFI